MYNEFDSSDIIKVLPMCFVGLFIILAILLIVYSCVKKQDDKKELITRKAKILEKPIQQGNIEWYVIELENGERLKLRNFHRDSVIITVGDVGIIQYRGKTIQSFQRQ